jgi:hypothetical protein
MNRYASLTIEQLQELEREAYAKGETDKADLLALVIEYQQELDAIEDANDD